LIEIVMKADKGDTTCNQNVQFGFLSTAFVFSVPIG